MTAPEQKKNHPLAFFVLVYTMSVPFWILSIRQGKSGLPDNIPMTDIGATLSPIIAHAIGSTARSAFPGGRQGYELGNGLIGYVIIILAAVRVTALWGKNTLSDFLGQNPHGGRIDA